MAQITRQEFFPQSGQHPYVSLCSYSGHRRVMPAVTDVATTLGHTLS